MRYTVLKSFADAQDNYHIYRAGEEYPRPDLEVSEERIRELSTAGNRLNTPLIKECIPRVHNMPLRAVEKPLNKPQGEDKREENPLSQYIKADIPDDFMPIPQEPTIPDDSRHKKRGRRKKNAD